MLLRIEDTDRERSTQSAIDAILDGLKWLGLDWDGDVVHQFARADRHREIAEALLAQGKAYRCYASPQELDEMRAKAKAEGRPPRYDGRWRDRDAAQAPAGVAPVIRLKTPLDGRNRDRRRGAGPRRVPQQGHRRFRAAALGRRADLYARRRRRRSRHGRDANHSRRRPPHQRRAAKAYLRGARLGRRRPSPIFRSSTGRTAPSSPSAMARSASTPIAPWAISPRRCAIIWRGWAGARATRSSSPARS